jgi:hypothetical protein
MRQNKAIIHVKCASTSIRRELNMKVIIDRFEGNFAVCEKENRQMIDIERSKIPCMAQEGDVLNISDDIITIDAEATEKRKKRIEEIAKDLWS